MRMASILSKYTSPDELKDLNAIDFMERLISKIDAKEYLELIEILLGRKVTEEISGNELMKIFISGMTKNDIMDLLISYNKIGTG